MRMRSERALAVVTILAIAGTLTSCGRYGRPVRPLPETAAQFGAAAQPPATAPAEEPAPVMGPDDADGDSETSGD